MERVVYCGCGGRMRAPESALGMQGVCVRCGNTIVVGEQNSFPLLDTPHPLPPLANIRARPQAAPAHQDARYAPDSGVSPSAHADPATKSYACARCGRTFRGAWDRNRSAEGEICHICARRLDAAPPVPEPAQTPPPPLRDFANPQTRHVVPPQAVQRGFAGRMLEPLRPAWEDWRIGGAALVGVAVVLILLADRFPVAEYIAEFFAAPVDLDSAVIAPWVHWLAFTLVLLRPVVQHFIMLYMLLAWCDALPNDTFVKNLIALGAVAVVLALIGWCVGMLTIVGFFLAMVLQVYFVVHLYDLNLEQAMRIFPCWFLAWLFSRAGFALLMGMAAALVI